MKRVLSFILVFMFSLSLVVPSFALADDSVIMPRRLPCPNCPNGLLNYQNVTKPMQVYTTSCPNHPGYWHLQTVAGRLLICSTCGAYGGADTSQSYSLLACTYGAQDCFNPNPQYLWNYN